MGIHSKPSIFISVQPNSFARPAMYLRLINFFGLFAMEFSSDSSVKFSPDLAAFFSLIGVGRHPAPIHFDGTESSWFHIRPRTNKLRTNHEQISSESWGRVSSP